MYGQFEETETWILDAWSVNFRFSVIVAFYLTETEKRTL